MAAVDERTGSKHAELHRMVMDDHVCPYGIKSKHLLEKHDFEIDDNWLRTREETDSFQEKHSVDTTPQVFIEGKRIGGYDELRDYLDEPMPDKQETTYRPVIAIFATSFAIGLAMSWALFGTVFTIRMPELFIATAMCLLGLQKLQDVESFSTMFLNYDLLAQRWVPYGYFYPFGETLAGVLMIAGALIWLAAPIALFIGTVGAISVFRAVYVDKRELKCACVGGDSNVPLGFISLTENLIMMLMGVWMPIRMWVLSS